MHRKEGFGETGLSQRLGVAQQGSLVILESRCRGVGIQRVIACLVNSGSEEALVGLAPASDCL